MLSDFYNCLAPQIFFYRWFCFCWVTVHVRQFRRAWWFWPPMQQLRQWPQKSWAHEHRRQKPTLYKRQMTNDTFKRSGVFWLLLNMCILKKRTLVWLFFLRFYSKLLLEKSNVIVFVGRYFVFPQVTGKNVLQWWVISLNSMMMTKMTRLTSLWLEFD